MQVENKDTKNLFQPADIYKFTLCIPTHSRRRNKFEKSSQRPNFVNPWPGLAVASQSLSLYLLLESLSVSLSVSQCSGGVELGVLSDFAGDTGAPTQQGL